MQTLVCCYDQQDPMCHLRLRLSDSQTQTLRLSESQKHPILRVSSSPTQSYLSDPQTLGLTLSDSQALRLSDLRFRLSGSLAQTYILDSNPQRRSDASDLRFRLSDPQRLSGSGSQTFRHVRPSDSQALRCKPQTRKDTRECRSCIAQTIPFSTTPSSILLPVLLPLPHSFRRLRHNSPVGWHDATMLGLSCVSVSSFVALLLASCVVLDPSDILAPDGPVLHVANPSTRKLSGKSRRRLRGCASVLVLTVEMQR